MNKRILIAMLLCLGSSVAGYSEETSADTKASNDAAQEGKAMSTVDIRYMIDDVAAAVAFYTKHLGFALEFDAGTAFAAVTRDGTRLLLSGKASSARRAMPDGREPVPGGWNRIHIVVDDIETEVTRLREAGVHFRNEIFKGRAGSQILLDDPSGNPVELFQNSARAQEGKPMSTVSFRYMIDDVDAAVDFYTRQLGFALELDSSPAFASVTRGGMRLLLSGKTSSGRRAMPDGTEPVPGGWNRIHIVVDDLEAEVKRLREAGVHFRNEIIKGQGGSQIQLDDPSGNAVELFQTSERYQLK